MLDAGHDQRQRCDLPQCERIPPTGLDQGFGDQGEQPLLKQRPHLQPRACFRLEQHRQVQVSGVELIHQVARQHFHQMQADIGVALTHPVDQGQAEDRSRRRRQADAGVTTHSPVLCGQHRMFGLTQRQTCVILEGHACCGRRDASA
ncbi:hypothetical protein D3C79_938130 [compost metagenome]